MAWCLYTFSFGQYYDYGTFEASESSLNAPGTSSSSGAEPTAHWDSWGPEQPANPWNAVTLELAANAWCAEPLPHQAVPLVPKAASVDASQVAPNTPPLEAEAEAPDRVAEWAQGNLAKLATGLQGGTVELKAAKQLAVWAQGKVAELEAAQSVPKPVPKPPEQDPLIVFAQAQADVPLVIDR